MTILSFQQFLNEEEVPTSQPIFPTHAELEGLHWFQSLKRTLNTIGDEPEWTTGKLAYSRGTRKLAVSRDEFIFYPLTGKIINGAFPMRAKIPFDSLESWNEALFPVYAKVISSRLGLNNSKSFSNAIVGRDSAKIIDWFNQVNQHLAEYNIDPRPEAFLFSILHEISTPDEREVITNLLQLGLI